MQFYQITEIRQAVYSKYCFHFPLTKYNNSTINLADIPCCFYLTNVAAITWFWQNNLRTTSRGEEAIKHNLKIYWKVAANLDAC